MWQGAHVAVIVPAYAEEELIGVTLEAIPSFVDHVIVVDDASPDDTASVVRRAADRRVTLVRHEVNSGVGAALATGYQKALESGCDVIVVMAGDNQMDPADLPVLLEPISRRRADYVKGNRFVHVAFRDMPRTRRIAGKVLAKLTNLASGLSIDDSQCGYTALSAQAARAIPWAELWPRYGYPNDLLILLGSRGFRVQEVPVRPIYAKEKSGVRPWHALTVAGVILRRSLLEKKRPSRRPQALRNS